MSPAISRRDEYLHYSLNFKSSELAMRDTMKWWLPEKIIDCHSHCSLPQHLPVLDPLVAKHMASTFTSYSLKESVENHGLFFERKQIQSLRFALPFNGLDHVAANTYLLEQSPHRDRIALYAPPNDAEYCCEMLRHPRVSALKMYYKAVVPWARTIQEYFPPQVLSLAEKLDIPIILHLPSVITTCLDDLLSLVKSFPLLRIVVAHLGSSKQVIPGLQEAFEQVAKYETVRMDTAMNPTAEVVSLALSTFGHERVMFGSDEPLHMVRSTVFTHPTLGERLVTEYPYHWVDSNEHSQYKHLTTNVVHALWQSLTAIKDAVAIFPNHKQQEVKEKIFFHNAKSFFGF